MGNQSDLEEAQEQTEICNPTYSLGRVGGSPITFVSDKVK